MFRPEPGVELRHRLHPRRGANDRMTRRSPRSRPASRRRAGASARCSSATPSPKQPGAAAVPAGLADALDAVRQLGLALAVDIAIVAGIAPGAAPGPHGRAAGRRPGRRRRRRTAAVARRRARPAARRRARRARPRRADRALQRGPLGDRRSARCRPRRRTSRSWCSADVPAGEVLAAIVEGAGELLEDAHLVDDYRGSGSTRGSKSLTFALRFRAPDRTLTAAEATDAKLAGRRPSPPRRLRARTPPASRRDRCGSDAQQFATARKISLGSCS